MAESKSVAASSTVEYSAWSKMIRRCVDPKDAAFRNYGGRGIKVCKKWLNSFENFLADMGPRPSAEHSIDRIDNDGNYEPGNCRWATRMQQNGNQRTNVQLTFDGLTMHMAAWAHHLGIKKSTLHWRIKSGQSLEVALSSSVMPKMRSNTTFYAICSCCHEDNLRCATCDVQCTNRYGDIEVQTVSVCAPCRRRLRHRCKIHAKHR